MAQLRNGGWVGGRAGTQSFASQGLSGRVYPKVPLPGGLQILRRVSISHLKTHTLREEFSTLCTLDPDTPPQHRADRCVSAEYCVHLGRRDPRRVLRFKVGREPAARRQVSPLPQDARASARGALGAGSGGSEPASSEPITERACRPVPLGAAETRSASICTRQLLTCPEVAPGVKEPPL